MLFLVAAHVLLARHARSSPTNTDSLVLSDLVLWNVPCNSVGILPATRKISIYVEPDTHASEGEGERLLNSLMVSLRHSRLKVLRMLAADVLVFRDGAQQRPECLLGNMAEFLVAEGDVLFLWVGWDTDTRVNRLDVQRAVSGGKVPESAAESYLRSTSERGNVGFLMGTIVRRRDAKRSMLVLSRPAFRCSSSSSVDLDDLPPVEFSDNGLDAECAGQGTFDDTGPFLYRTSSSAESSSSPESYLADEALVPPETPRGRSRAKRPISVSESSAQVSESSAQVFRFSVPVSRSSGQFSGPSGQYPAYPDSSGSDEYNDGLLLEESSSILEVGRVYRDHRRSKKCILF